MTGLLKKILKKVFPFSVTTRLARIKNYVVLFNAFIYDFIRYSKYSSTISLDSKSNLVGRIIMEYHIIEKGLTMPEPRLGFGSDKLRLLICHCNQFAEKYGSDHIQFRHAIGVIKEYQNFHSKHNYILEPSLSSVINSITEKFDTIKATHQTEYTGNDFFKYTYSSFVEFSNSRHSVRQFAESDVPLERILDAINLSMNTPSACNRQTSFVYVYTEKDKINEILNIQGGSRGFGHLTNKLIVLTAETGVFIGEGERTQAFIDGGMFAMNLLYSLHYYKIGCCTLNCSNSVIKDRKLRKLCKIKDSEIFVAMFSCGTVSENFRVPISTRDPMESKVKVF